MPIRIKYLLFVLALLVVPTVEGAPTINKVGIKSRDSQSDITLSCNHGMVTFLINWNQQVGIKGKKRRHLFYRTGRDEHVMLPVVDATGSVTGYENNPRMAKMVISEVLRASQHDAVLIGVFPAGADPVNGEWIDASFDFEEFSKAAKEVAARCKWDIAADLKQPHTLDTKPPTPPGYDMHFPDEG